MSLINSVLSDLRRRRLAIGLAAAFLFWLAIARFEGNLRLLHPPGTNGYGVGTLWRGSGRARTALNAWDQSGGELTSEGLLAWSGRSIAAFQLWLSIGLTVSIGLLLLSLGKWLARQEPEPATADVPDDRGGEQSEVTAWQVLPHIRYVLIAFIVIDIVDNVLALMVLGGSDVLFRPLQVLFWARIVSGGVVLLFYGIMLASHFWGQAQTAAADDGPRWLTGATRVQLITVAVFALVMTFTFTSEQAEDAARLWLDKPVHAIAAFGALTAFSVAIVTAGRLMHRPEVKQIDPPASLVLLVGLLFGAVGAVLMWLPNWGPGVVAGGGIIAATGLLSFLLDRRRPWEKAPHESTLDAVQVKKSRARILTTAGIPWVVTAGLLLRTGINDWLVSGFSWPLFVSLLVAMAGGYVVPGVLSIGPIWATLSGDRSGTDTSGRRSRNVLIAVAAVVFGSWHWAIVASPFWFPLQVGTIAIATMFAVEVVVVLSILGRFALRLRPPAILRLLRWRRRLPAITLLVVWGLVGAVFDGGSTQHDVRMRADNRTPLGFDTYFESWLAPNLPGDADPDGVDDPDAELPAVPLVLVATHGGGIKAAAWTSFVLDCAVGTNTTCPVEHEPWAGLGSVFVMSGASGGTVGLVSVTTERMSGGNTDWVKSRLSTDLLSPSLAWQLFVEAPMTLPRARSSMDRAEVLERTWSRQWEGVPNTCTDSDLGEDSYYDRWAAWNDGDVAGQCRFPVILSNGTSLLDGCLVNVSTFDDPKPQPDVGCGGNQADATDGLDRTYAWDAADFLCRDENLAASTAAFLSARFPFVSPSGRLVSPNDRGRDCGGAVEDELIHIGDGGYRDNTGASGIVDVLAQLAPLIADAPEAHGVCVVPVVVEISSGYRDNVAPSTRGRIYEGIAPLSGALSVFGSRDRADPELLVAATADSVVSGYDITHNGEPAADRHVRFGLFSTPGAQAPLGWLLSEESADNLVAQLSLEDNLAAFEKLAGLLEPGALRCSRPGPT